MTLALESDSPKLSHVYANIAWLVQKATFNSLVPTEVIKPVLSKRFLQAYHPLMGIAYLADPQARIKYPVAVTASQMNNISSWLLNERCDSDPILAGKLQGQLQNLQARTGPFADEVKRYASAVLSPIDWWRNYLDDENQPHFVLLLCQLHLLLALHSAIGHLMALSIHLSVTGLLRAWKHFPEVVRDSPRKGSKCTKPPNVRSQPRVLSDFAIFARHKGFENAQISRLANSPWKTKSIKEFLDQFTLGGSYWASDIETAVEEIEPILRNFLHAVVPRHHSPPILAHNLVMTGEEQRYGMPFEETFAEDRHSLDMHFMSTPPCEGQTVRSKYVSSFSVLRDQFRCFFGDGGALSLEASGHSHCAASNSYDSDGDDPFCAQDDLCDRSSYSDVSKDVFLDAHECLRRKRSCSVESQSPIQKAIRRK